MMSRHRPQAATSSVRQELAGVGSLELVPTYLAALLGPVPSEVAQVEAAQALRRLLSPPGPPMAEVLGALAPGDLLPHLVHLLATTPSTALQWELAWALTNIASSTESEHTREVVRAGAVPVMVALLQSPCPNVREQCAWCLGNIAGDGAALRDVVLDTPGVVHHLQLNLQHPEGPTLHDTCAWALANCCKGSPAVRADHATLLLPVLLELLCTHSASPVAVGEASWGLYCLATGDDSRSHVDALWPEGRCRPCCTPSPGLPTSWQLTRP